MVERIRGPYRPPAAAPSEPAGRTTPRQNGAAFQQILQQQLQAAPVALSAHAQLRLQQRQITLTPPQLQRLQQAVDRAAAKGARESLILVDDLAFVTSIRNRTVVTVMQREEAKQNIFTNIDSALIV